METRHLSRPEWLTLLEPHLPKLRPGTRAALLSGNTSFTDGPSGIRYTTDPVSPITGPTHHVNARVDSVTDGKRTEYVQ